MNELKLRNELVDFFNESAKECCSLVGVEFEHYIINKYTMESYDYFSEKGLKEILGKLEKLAWQELSSEDGNVLGLVKEGNTITLEPGGQIELSLAVCKTIKEVALLYNKIIEEIKSVLSEDQTIVALGYHPKTKIESLEFLPKARYKYMSDYLGKQGKYAHNMMKGTASTQTSIDFTDEADFIKKFRVANFLSPFISRIFDATPVFEGDLYQGENKRVEIWQHTDNDRSGIVPGVLDKDFGFEDYVDYLMAMPPILITQGTETIFTKDEPLRSLLKEYTFDHEDQLHLLSMPFPDVRLKSYIEIRMADSINYPMNLSVPALLKGIFYDEKNLNKYYEISKAYTNQDMNKIKDLLLEEIDFQYKSINIFEFVKELLDDAFLGLSTEDQVYLLPIMEIIKKNTSYSRMLKGMYSDRDKFVEAISVGGQNE